MGAEAYVPKEAMEFRAPHEEAEDSDEQEERGRMSLDEVSPDESPEGRESRLEFSEQIVSDVEKENAQVRDALSKGGGAIDRRQVVIDAIALALPTQLKLLREGIARPETIETALKRMVEKQAHRLGDTGKVKGIGARGERATRNVSL